jgi:hypothetical protein
MQPRDITIEILTDIRDGVRRTNARLDEVNERIDGTNARLESVRDTLSRRIVEAEIRSAMALAQLVGTVGDLTLLLRAEHDLRPRVEQCERDIDDLRRRLP